MTQDLSEFEAVYRRHVAAVVAGDLAAVMADMDPAVVPAVFEGVRTPGREVLDGEVLDVRLEDGRGIGEAVYQTPDGPIGLRSGWRHEGRWLADRLENVEPGR